MRSPTQSLIFLPTLGSKLLEIGPQIRGFFLVLVGEDHLCPGHLGLRIFQVFLEARFTPHNSGVLVAVAISVAFGRPGFPAIKSIELGTQLVLRRLADVMAGLTFSERGFPSRYVLRYRMSYRCRQDHRADHHTSNHHLFSSLKADISKP